VLLRLDCHVANLSASLEISLSHQAVYYYLLDNPVSGPSFVPTVIAALHPSNTTMMNSKMETVAKLTSDLKVEDIGSPNLLVVMSFMPTAKEPLDFMMRAFNSLGDQVQELSSLPSEVERTEEESHSEL